MVDATPLIMLMTRENLNSYQGENNVTKIVNEETGSISYLTQSTSLSEEAFSKGAVKFNTFENEKKHVLFLFNSADAEVGRFYLGQKLWGKSLDQIAELKSNLCCFKSWNPNANNGEGAWVPCIGLSTQTSLASTAHSL